MGLFDSEKLFSLSEPEREELVSALRKAVSREAQVRACFLFGSFARKEPFRDVDLGMDLIGRFTLFDVAHMANRLWIAAGRPSFDLDVVPLNDAPPSFRLEVADTGIIVLEREPGDALDFAVRAQSELLDFREAVAIVARENEVHQ